MPLDGLLDANWRENAVEALEDGARKRGQQKGRRGWEKLRVNLTPALIAALDRACRARGISRAAYIRRALAVVIAHDIGTTWRELVATSPAPMNYGRTAYTRDFPATTRDDGTGYGDWDLIP